MARVFTWEFDVRSYELDSFGHVNNAVYSNYVQEVATRASADVGFGYHWYFERQRAWVIRQMTIHYLTPLRYGEEVRLRTWVSDFRRIYSHREYDLRRACDDKPAVRARAKWVYVDLEAIRPIRIPAEMEVAFQPTGVLDDIPVRLEDPRILADNPAFVYPRRVQRYEIDPSGHVNNAVYLNWFEQAMFSALAAVGWPVARMAEIGLGLVQAGHIVDYLRPVLDDEPLEIVSRPTELAETRGAWQHEVRQAETGEILARDYSVGAFLDLATGQSCALPEAILEAVLKGPA